MTDYTPGAGDVEIELKGMGKLWLKPTLGACIKLSSLPDFSGPRSIFDQCAALNLYAIALTIQIGIEAEEKDRDKIRDAVFQTGTIRIFGACMSFLHNVSNGGRPLGEDGAEAVDPLPNK